MRAAEAPAESIRPISDVLDDYPALTPELLRLCEWIASYYFCGVGEAVRAALPPGIEVESQRRARVAGPGDPDRVAALDNRGRALYKAVAAHSDSVAVSHLRRTATSFSGARLSALQRAGLVEVFTQVAAPRTGIRIERAVSFAPGLDRAAIEESAEGLRGEKQRRIVATLMGLQTDGDYPAPRTEVLRIAEASGASLKGLVEKGLVVESERELARHLEDAAPAVARTVALHAQQGEALRRISDALAEGVYTPFLLHGVTGSGKTEVYIRALKATLERGRSGIILVPEIALTPQTVSRFRAHFGDEIAVLHSRMALGERFDSWRHIREGRHRVVIGPRSAVLAPVSDLGLIVVDEEHEQSYKQQEPAPRYHARDVALLRALNNNAVCVLGSATPSLESYANANSGKYVYLEMKERAPTAGSAPAVLPSVRVIDLTVEKKKGRLEGVLSAPLRSAIAARLRAGEQTILLQNRRGYAPTVECTACGWAPSCPDCSVTMTYHKSGGSLRCHYCGRTERYPRECPACGSRALLNLGTGTQRVQEELTSLFPDARVLRMDLDTTSRKNAHHAILRRFEDGRADVLVGTQMVAKGLDFAAVTLVGVVDADTGLLFPDFRAEERTFQLLTQVAGRAGRGERAGEVLLQTRNAGSPAIQHAIQHNFAAFADYALRQRAALSYPPFGRIVAVYFRGSEEDRVMALGRAWTEAVIAADDGLVVLGPHAAFIARVRNQYRYVTVIKVPQRYGRENLRAVLDAATVVRRPPDCHVVVDVDAAGIL